MLTVDFHSSVNFFLSNSFATEIKTRSLLFASSSGASSLKQADDAVVDEG